MFFVCNSFVLTYAQALPGPVGPSTVPMFSIGSLSDLIQSWVDYQGILNERHPKLFAELDKITAIGPQLVNDLWENTLNPYKKSDGTLDISNPDSPIHSDGKYVYITNSFNKVMNEKLQENVHRLNGFYLFEPTLSAQQIWEKFFLDSDNVNYPRVSWEKYWSDYDILAFRPNSQKRGSDSFNMPYTGYYGFITYPHYESYDTFCYVNYNSKVVCGYINSSDGDVYSLGGISYKHLRWGQTGNMELDFQKYLDFSSCSPDFTDYFYWTKPVKIFYSALDAKNYFTQGRTYAPNYPKKDIKIPVGLFNPDGSLNINIDSLVDKIKLNLPDNPTEVQVQLEIDKLFDKLLDLAFTSGGNDTPVVTPTPGGGGGGFTDNTTPAPTLPPFGDDTFPSVTPVPSVDMTETNDFLKKIYEWLESFGSKYDSFIGDIKNALKEDSEWRLSFREKYDSFTNDLITRMKSLAYMLSTHFEKYDKFTAQLLDYLDKDSGKMEQIITILDDMVKDKDSEKEGGYDYEELSMLLTNLWIESDHKMEKMIKLLEENNRYQQKLLDSLNDIKNILYEQTIMDYFEDRSKETAKKAQEKFPTSVPWDIVMVLNAMRAEPVDPVISLPINIDSVGIHEEITVDLTSGEWAKLAKACRNMLSLLFILYMIHLTRELFFKDGD